MELRPHAIKRWVPCGDIDRRLKIPHSAKAECGFRTTPEDCLYDSGPIDLSIAPHNTIQYNTCSTGQKFVQYEKKNIKKELR